MLGDHTRQLRLARVQSRVRDERRHARRDIAERRSSRSHPTPVATRGPICMLIKKIGMIM